MEWEAQSYEQLKWGNIAWALRGNAQLGNRNIEIVAPIINVASGEYHLRTPVVLSDHDAFIAIGSKGYKAERYIN